MSLVIDHLNQLVSQPSEHGADMGAADSPAQESSLEPTGLWVPSERILVFRVELPKVSKRKQQEMLPWLLEDRLLSSPDDFEFIVGAELNENETLVYVLEKAVLGQWMLLSESASVSPVRMVPDFLALPYEDGRWTVYTDEGRLLVRTGVYEGFAADAAFGWQQLELLLAQLEEPVRLSHLASSEVDIPENFVDRLDTETGKISWSFTEFPIGLDVLPTSYRPKRSSSVNAWIPAMSAAAILIILLLSYMLVQSWAWQRDAQVLETAVTQTYEQLFAKKLPGNAIDAADAAREDLALLEHQYIVTQTSPLAEFTALDRVFSTCSDCVLMKVSQKDSGLDIQLKDNERLRSRLNGIEGWTMIWGAPNSTGMNTLTMTSTLNASAQRGAQ